MAAGGVEASLVSVVLHIDLLPLGGDEAVTAADGVRGSHLLSGGSIVIGKAAINQKHYMRPKYFVVFT